MTACDFEIREAMCADGDYPVWSTKFPESGGACVADGAQPPQGYAKYPDGLAPVYFDQVTECDDQGRCENGPLAIVCPKTWPKAPCKIGDVTLPESVHPDHAVTPWHTRLGTFNS